MTQKECFFCGELIDSNRNYCPFCGERLDVRCSQCHRPVSAMAKICPYCNKELTPKPPEGKESCGTAALVLMFIYSAICIAICFSVIDTSETALANATVFEKLTNIRDLFVLFLFPFVTSIVACCKKQGIIKAVISLVLTFLFGLVTLLVLIGS